jgi:hypothetical protein
MLDAVRGHGMTPQVEPAPQPHVPKLVDLGELAKLWNLPKTWLHHATRAGAADPLPCVRLGKYVRVDLGDPRLAAWLSRRKAGQ